MSKICNRKLISASLLEWTLSSTTNFIDSNNDDLKLKAEKLGIVLPSPDLACFSTIYCELGKYNLNGVKFSKEVAEKGLKTLVGKQINLNHEGAHQIMGYLIDAEIKDNKILVTGILFKSLFREEFSEIIQLFAEKKLFCSFELWNLNEKGESIVKDLGNGKRELTEFIGHGCALLLIDPQTNEPIPPACPVAQVLKLLASRKMIEEGELIVEKIFEHNDNLVYAKLVKEEPICTNCKKCKCNEEGGKENIMLEEIKIETILPEVKPEEVAQVVVEEPKVEATVVEPIIEPAIVETVTIAEPIIEEKPVEATTEVKVEEIKIEEIQVKEVIIEETQAAEVKPEEVEKTTPEETKVEAEVKPEIVAEVVKEEIVEVKFTQAEVEAKLAEKEIEITNLKKELDSKNQEIAELKAPKVEIAKVEEEPELTVGNTETKTSQKYVEVRKKLNKKAYGHESKGN